MYTTRMILEKFHREAVYSIACGIATVSHSPIECHSAVACISANAVVHVVLPAPSNEEINPEGHKDCLSHKIRDVIVEVVCYTMASERDETVATGVDPCTTRLIDADLEWQINSEITVVDVLSRAAERPSNYLRW